MSRRLQDPRLAAWAAARSANAIAVSEDGSACICAPCVRSTPLEGDDLDIIGTVRIATATDIQRAPFCMGCEADMAAPLNGRATVVRPVLVSAGALLPDAR